jgi:hypothetical protein
VTPRCRNRRCRERLLFETRLGLCPSCLFIVKVGFFVGGVLAGAALALFPTLKELVS